MIQCYRLFRHTILATDISPQDFSPQDYSPHFPIDNFGRNIRHRDFSPQNQKLVANCTFFGNFVETQGEFNCKDQFETRVNLQDSHIFQLIVFPLRGD